ncbi:hypothetical protein MBLNU459_g7227t1 [Dothideomycetes sp. NU459]
MADQNNNSPPTSISSPRRSSFAGQTFADLFGTGRSRPSDASSSSSPPGNQFNGPITSAAHEASRRRLSLSTVGLSGSPSQTSPFSAMRDRNNSVSSSNAASIDETAVEDDPSSAAASQPTTPFARRVSFGARALRDMNKPGNAGGGGTGPNGRASITSTSTIPEDVAAEGGGKKTSPDVAPPNTVKARGLSSSSTAGGSVTIRRLPSLTPCASAGEPSFNWADNMRTRAERTSTGGGSSFNTSPGAHHRAKSVAVMEQPVRAAPRPANVPDQFQERILKGDFYMD